MCPLSRDSSVKSLTHVERGDWPISASELPMVETRVKLVLYDLVIPTFRHRCIEALQECPIIQTSMSDAAIW